MKSFIRNAILIVVNLGVFLVAWVLLGNLAETLIHKYMNDTINMPQAFAWGAINALVAHALARIVEAGVEYLVWGDHE